MGVAFAFVLRSSAIGRCAASRRSQQIVSGCAVISAVLKTGQRYGYVASKHSSLLEHNTTSKNGSSPQGRVESVERDRSDEKDSRQADARIPCRTVSRKGKQGQDVLDNIISHQNQQTETDKQ